jgi:peptide/nickel transport system permease protein
VRQYIARRLLQSVVILFVLSILVFVLLRIAPGADPALLRCGVLTCTEEHIEALRNEMGLHDPYFPVSAESGPPFLRFHAQSQYWRWVKQLGTGSLGKDWNNVSVASELQKRLPVTVELLIITVLATVALGVPFGVISAISRNSIADYGVRFSAVLGLAVPNFWVATLVLLIPLQYWHYAPPLTVQVGFFDDPWTNLRQFVPPALVLAAGTAASVMRLTRSAMLEVMRQDYIRTARAKGLREQIVIGRHALKNSLIPVITVIGLLVAGLFGGSVIIENIFNLRGVGNYELNALIRRDFTVAQTLTVYVGMVVVLLNLLVDIMYAWLDPRIRYS